MTAISQRARYHVIRVEPGMDLREDIERYLERETIEAAVMVSGIGSLHHASLRLAGAAKTAHFDGPFEILALNGTLSRHGCHLHIHLADTEGGSLGGHLLRGSDVHTTAEIVMAEFPDMVFNREADSRTGYNELVIDQTRINDTQD